MCHRPRKQDVNAKAKTTQWTKQNRKKLRDGEKGLVKKIIG